jgi:hypothetical protein
MKGKSFEIVKLSVYPVRRILGDVDYSTGHIEFPDTVQIEGSVKSGFEVRAEGSVIIGGDVENDVTVRAGGDVAVQHGISGSTTRIEADGSIYAQFVGSATVRVQHDLTVGSYLLGASIRSSGSVLVTGVGVSNPKSGAILGGFVLAVDQIRAQNIGSASVGSTKVVAGVDLTLAKKESDLQKQIEVDHILMAQMLRTLNLESPDMERIKCMLVASTGPERKRVAGAVKKLMELLARHEKAMAEKERVNKILEEVARTAAIEVTGTAFGGTVVGIGGQSMTIKEETSGMSFSLVEADDILQLQMTPTM